MLIFYNMVLRKCIYLEHLSTLTRFVVESSKGRSICFV